MFRAAGDKNSAEARKIHLNELSLQNVFRHISDFIMDNRYDGALTLGIDVGGTNAAFGVVDSSGNIVCRGSVPVKGYESLHDFIVAFRGAVEAAMLAAGLDFGRLVEIGVGAPCLNWETGVIEGAVNMPWSSPMRLTDELSAVFGLPAAGENDANAAALGEMHFGAGKGLDNFIMLTLGTGVGGAVICDGRLMHGKRGLAGELGHIPVFHGPDARQCNCGRRGCGDAYLSARGIVATALELLAVGKESSSLRPGSLDARAVGEAAAAGDPVALRTFRITGEILGRACADFTAFSSPEAFIFFGGVARSFPFFEAPMKEAFESNLLWVYKDQVKFMPTALPEADAAILGAAAVARNARLHK